MPEGHTLHRLAGELSATFAGRAVRVTSPQGRFAESAALVDGSVVTGAEAWGKHLFVAFEGGRFVHVHLGLYGTFLVHPVVEEVPGPVGQVRMRLEAGAPGAASYADLRGATTCALLTGAERAAVVARQGPDPLRQLAFAIYDSLANTLHDITLGPEYPEEDHSRHRRYDGKTPKSDPAQIFRHYSRGACHEGSPHSGEG